jgi:hypothetical protein
MRLESQHTAQVNVPRKPLFQDVVIGSAGAGESLYVHAISDVSPNDAVNKIVAFAEAILEEVRKEDP